MTDSLLLSIIVPIHNAEKTLERCVHSLFHQGITADKYEIILVNDGSTDSSEALCNELKSEAPFIRVITQACKGVSVARNAGIQSAKGEYICFVDADDYLAEDGLSIAVSRSENHPDMIRYWCRIVYGKNKPIEKAIGGDVYYTGTGHDYIKKFGLEVFCCNNLYRRAFLLNNHLFFDPNIILGEDFRFMADVMLENPSIVSLSLPIYNYIIHKESASTDRNVTKKRIWVSTLLNTFSRIEHKTKQLLKNDAQLYIRCHSSLRHFMPSLFSRVLSADFSKEEFVAICCECQRMNLIPTPYQVGESRKLRISFWLCNYLAAHPGAYLPARFFYKNFFVKYVYRFVNRNR